MKLDLSSVSNREAKPLWAQISHRCSGLLRGKGLFGLSSSQYKGRVVLEARINCWVRWHSVANNVTSPARILFVTLPLESGCVQTVELEGNKEKYHFLHSMLGFVGLHLYDVDFLFLRIKNSLSHSGINLLPSLQGSLPHLLNVRV